MDKIIKAVARKLQIGYGLFLLISILLCLAYELGWIDEGGYATDVRMQYMVETVGILTTVILVPLSLKLFSYLLNKRMKQLVLVPAIRFYLRLSGIRLLLLGGVVWLNLFVYYSTLSNVGGFCALIGVTASVFCLPGEKKVRDDFNLTDIQTEKEEEL